MAKVSSRGTQLFCSVFIGVGLIALGVGVWMMIKSLRSEHWPVTDGVILSAEIKSHSGEHGNTYSAEVTYDYHVGGVGYTGKKSPSGRCLHLRATRKESSVVIPWAKKFSFIIRPLTRPKRC